MTSKKVFLIVAITAVVIALVAYMFKPSTITVEDSIIILNDSIQKADTIPSDSLILIK